MKELNLVLTGGPYAGKTTALENIKKHLKERNIPCVTVPETATELIDNGIIPTKDNIVKFQLLVMKRQIVKERDAMEYIVDNYKNAKLGVIIYDRGIFDNMAYLNTREDFEELLHQNHLSEIEALDRYDMILDLQSLATCKPEEYGSNKNNDARKEDVEQAKELDKKTSNAWVNHRNLKIISSRLSLEEETKIILGYVDDLIEEVNRTYIDRFLIDDKNSNIKKYLEKDYILITERYLDINYHNYIFKISKRFKGGKDYILEVYKEYNGKKVTAINERISEYKVASFLSRFNTLSVINKREINFVENSLLYKLNIYDDKILLEVHKNNPKEEVLIPQNLTIQEKLSDDSYNIEKDDQKKIRKLLNN